MIEDKVNLAKVVECQQRAIERLDVECRESSTWKTLVDRELKEIVILKQENQQLNGAIIELQTDVRHYESRLVKHKKENQTKYNELKDEFKNEVHELKTDFRQEIGGVKNDISELRKDLFAELKLISGNINKVKGMGAVLKVIVLAILGSIATGALTLAGWGVKLVWEGKASVPF